MRNLTKIVAIGAFAAIAGSASGAVILTYGFTDLDGSYDHPTTSFQAISNGNTSGDVSRLAAPGGTADYNPGFAAPANVAIHLSVFNKVGNLAQGSGTFSIFDADGDELHGNIDGVWIGGTLGVYFNGDLSNVVLDNNSPDATFDGPNGGSFSDALPGIPPYEGTFIQLFIRTGGFFTRSFGGVSVQASGEIVPGAGSIALLGLAGLGAMRRRR